MSFTYGLRHDRKQCPNCYRDFARRYFSKHIATCHCSEQNIDDGASASPSKMHEEQLVDSHPENEDTSNMDVATETEMLPDMEESGSDSDTPGVSYHDLESETEMPPNMEESVTDSDTAGVSNDDYRTNLRTKLRERIACKNYQNLEEEDVNQFFSDMESNDEIASDSDASSNDEGHEDYMFVDGDSQPNEQSNEDSCSVGKFVANVCLLVAFWQAVFNITDSAVTVLLNFISKLLSDLANIMKLGLIARVAKQFPNTLYRFSRKLGVKKDNFVRVVVCPKCAKLYSYNSCYYTVAGIKYSKTCDKTEFRKTCGAPLMEKYKLPNGNTNLRPSLEFCYQKLESVLQRMVMRSGYEASCEAWRDRVKVDGVLTDVYDGRIWKEFEDNRFFESRRSYCLMVNLDWFQPFKHVNYSVGAVYLVNLNLPRSERFKRENVILYGIIPRMKTEPSPNTFIRPLVEELLRGWRGFRMTTNESPNDEVTVKTALVCVGCDIPASRKLGGFLGHSATRGCSKCLKQFPGAASTKDYSGFDRDSWVMRTDSDHRDVVRRIQKCRTKQDKTAMESNFGARYSVLLELPYYSCIKMCIIDPMHNLFCGTGRRMIRVWKETKRVNGKPLLSDADFARIQDIVDSVETPTALGKIPYKIASNFSSFTADQMKNWILYYSIPALTLVKFPKEHLECWRKFVLACRFLCTKVITVVDLIKADQLLMDFCHKFVKLYGAQAVTPNIHLHGHLVECCYDYGPIYGFWLFSYERYNGILSSLPTNKRRVEAQIFQKFELEAQVREMAIPDRTTLIGQYISYLKTEAGRAQRGVLGEEEAPVDASAFLCVLHRSSLQYSIVGQNWSDTIDVYSTGKCHLVQVLDSELQHLTEMYRTLYGERSLFVPPNGFRFQYVRICGQIIGSQGSRTHRSSLVQAHWPTPDGRIEVRPEILSRAWPGLVNYFVKHNVSVDGVTKSHLLANVTWYSPIDNDSRDIFGKPIEVWRANVFLPKGSGSFIPIQRIKQKFLQLPVKSKGRQCVAIIPVKLF